MKSATKRSVEEGLILELTEEIFYPKRVGRIEELVDGYFNTSYLLVFTDGTKKVLKIAPDQEVPVQRYEYKLMAAEVAVLKLLEPIEGIHIPRVLYYEPGHDILGGPFFFMEYLSGLPLNKVKDRLCADQYNRIAVQLAEQVKSIHKIEGAYYGFINNKDRRYSEWMDCFFEMVMDLFKDAEDVSLVLPISADEAGRMIKRYAWAFEGIKAPVLIHKDLWEGNIFVSDETFEITGIIDCERALYGEPMFEVVCAFQQNNTKFIQAFLGRNELTDHEAARIKLYELYIYLLMYIEIPYRKYKDKAIYEWSKRMLEASIQKLRVA